MALDKIDVSQAAPIRRYLIVAASCLVLFACAINMHHVLGLFVYLPQLDQLFDLLHKDPILIAALREQNTALADKSEEWTKIEDQTWTAERLSGEGSLQSSYIEKPSS